MYTRQVDSLYNLVKYEYNETLDSAIQSVDLTTIAEYYLNTVNEEYIEKVLVISQYIETETTLESPISDELYDKLHARYVELTGHSIVGTNNTSGSNKPLKEHLYPELRGSLDKVHFVFSKDIPKKDSRKSFQQWFEGVYNKCEMNLSEDFVEISYGLKYDGLSAVFECTDNHIDNILTRKDVDNNIGVDITHILPTHNVLEIFPDMDIRFERGLKGKYGVKTEIIMTLDNFKKFCEVVPVPPKNHRSAVSMILNTSASEYNPEWFQYLTIVPLQLSCNVELSYNKPKLGNINDIKKYLHVLNNGLGVMNGRQQYLLSPIEMSILTFNTDHYLELENRIINDIKFYADDIGIPIDGVVCTIRDIDMIEALGRKDNINQYQIAYKFPAGIAKTILKDVEFQVGPVAGTITPVAIVEPVVIMGNTINSPSLSNLNKLERLDLNIGDEVLIKYDIVPTLMKDDTCKKGTGRHIDAITHCPICNEELEITEDKSQARCINKECPTKTSGKIYNFINKMNIPDIGLATIEVLVKHEFLDTPADLYRLVDYRNQLTQIPGFGDKSVDSLITSIMSHRSAHIHDLLGSLGIPDVGRRTMKKIADDGSVSIDELLSVEDPSIIGRLSNVKGIGEITANRICNGIFNNKALIDDLLRYIEIIPYEKSEQLAEVVLFTKVRDPKFASFLEETKQANVAGSYNKSVTIVITPDNNTTSDKVTKALKDGKTVMSIEDAYKRFNYSE